MKVIFFTLFIILFSGCRGADDPVTGVTQTITAQTVTTQPVVAVTTIAGSAKVPAGDVSNVSGINALLNKPMGLITDPDDNLYVADSGNNKIKKITPEGIVTVYADPTPQAGDPTTPATSGLTTPCALAVDASGNIYVADTFNYVVRQIMDLQNAPVIAGGIGAYGITFDRSGAIYVTDSVAFGSSTSNIIRKIDPTTAPATVTTIITADAHFDNPYGIVADSKGNLFVSDQNNHIIRKINIATKQLTVFAGLNGVHGSSDDTGAEARFDTPAGLAIDKLDNIYVADSNNSTIRKITPDAVVTTIAGYANHNGSADGVGSSARFWKPLGIAVDSKGNIYVSEFFNNTIRKITINQ